MPDEATVAAVVPAESPTLAYAPPRRRQTRWIKLALLVLLALMLAAVMPHMWTEFGYRVGRRDFERTLLTFTAPPGALAYGEGDDAAKLAADPAGSWISPSNVWQPTSTIRGGRSRNAPTWLAWFALAGYRINDEATLFLHERTSPGGSRRLVAVALTSAAIPGSR
jgi:hypothetical protein